MSVSVAWKTGPFSLGSACAVQRPAGMSLLDIAGSVDVLPSGFEARGAICVNFEPVPREHWRYVRPREGAIVTLHAALGGGGDEGGGGQSTTGKVLTTVAVIAVIAAAAFISGGGLVPLLGAAFEAGTFGAAAASAAFTLGASLAISALSPPPTLAGAPSAAGGQSTALGRTGGSASLSGNLLQAGAPVPRVIGTAEVLPPFASQPLVEQVGDDEFAEAVLVLSGPHRLQNIKIAGTPVAQIEEVQVETADGFPGSTTNLVSRQGRTEGVNMELSQHRIDPVVATRLKSQGDPESDLPDWHTFFTRDDPEEIWITLTFPTGHYSTTAVGVAQRTPYRIRIRQAGTEDWTNLPEIWFSSSSQTPLQRVLKIIWGTAEAITPIPADIDAFITAFIATQPQTVAPATEAWVADSSFDDGAGDDYLDSGNTGSTAVQNVDMYEDRVEFFLAGSASGAYEVQIKQGYMITASAFTPSTYKYSDDVVWDYFAYYDLSGFNVTREDQLIHEYAAVIPRVSSVWNEHPVQCDEFAQIAVRIHNRQLSALSVVASGYVRDYNATTGEWDTLKTTSNPAPHLRDVLVGDLSSDPLPVDLLTDSEFVAWRTNNILTGHEVNGVAEGQSAREIARVIASAGFARLRQSETWGVIEDKDRSGEAITQLFGPRNMRGFTWRHAFPKLPDGLRVVFNDAARSYRERQVIVLDPEQDTGGERLEEIRYDFTTSEALANERALHDLAQAHARPTIYSGGIFLEWLSSRRGDLVGVQYDTLDRAAGAARVKAKTTTGGAPDNVTSITLDGTVPNDEVGFFLSEVSGDFFLDEGGGGQFFLSPQLGVALRGSDGAVAVKEVTGDDDPATVLTFVTPFEDLGEVEVGDLVTTGRLGTEFRRMIIAEMSMADDRTASLSFIDEAPELFSSY